MAELYLDKIGTEYKSGNYIITVTSEPYKGFRLFRKIRFMDKYTIPFHYFSIRAKERVIMEDYESRKDDKVDYIDYVDVYVSRYHKDKPLVIGVFNAGIKKYYKMSELVLNKKYGLHNLGKDFKLNGYLSNYLIDENDKINNRITFRLDKKHDYHNIKVSEDPSLSGFVIYEHELKDIKFENNKPLILYKNILFNVKPSNKFDNERRYKYKSNKFSNISVYFNQNEELPLMVKLVEFQTNDNYYFYRRNRNTWAQIQIEENNLERELNDRVNKLVFYSNYSIKVSLNKKQSYTINHSQNVMSLNTNKLTINVSQEKDNPNLCEYECFVQELKDYEEHMKKQQSSNSNLFVLRLFIWDNEIEIPMDEDYLLYEKNTVKVYFYKDDNVPLLFEYNGKCYCPQSKKEYFIKWKEISGILNTEGINKKLIEELVKINRMLNEVNLDEISDYGIDYVVDELKEYDNEHVCLTEECKLRCKLDTESKVKSPDYHRIQVKCEPCNENIFLKYTHTTKNQFYIGSVTYNSKNILGTPEFVCNSKDVSITVYYFNFHSENRKGFPLLLVCKSKNILNYYCINEKHNDDESEVEYELKQIENFRMGLYNFLDHQNFSLNNVICVDIHKKYDYKCCGTKGIYCEKKKMKVESVEIGEYSKFTKEKYSTYSHSLVDENEELEKQKSKENQQSDVKKSKTPITVRSLRIGSEIIKLTHTNEKIKDPLFETSVSYVHFYGEDPRPLLVYCDDSAFAPESIDNYKKTWSLVKDIDYSKRGDGNYQLGSVLNKLHEISYILNPVDISKSGTYTIDKHFWEEIKINVELKKFKYYKLYVHTASIGFRLGIIKHKEHVLDPSYAYKSNNIKQVIVYHYHFDSDNKYPLLVQLNLDSHPYIIFYLLSSTDPPTWTRIHKTYLQPSLQKAHRGPILQFFNKLFDENDFQVLKTKILSEFKSNEHEMIEKYQYESIDHLLTEDELLTFKTTILPDFKFDEHELTREIEPKEPLPIMKRSEPTRHKREDSVGEAKHTPPIVDIDVKTLETTSNNPDSNNKILASGIGGFFGSAFALGGSLILIYKMFLKVLIKDMRPSI